MPIKRDFSFCSSVLTILTFKERDEKRPSLFLQYFVFFYNTGNAFFMIQEKLLFYDKCK